RRSSALLVRRTIPNVPRAGKRRATAAVLTDQRLTRTREGRHSDITGAKLPRGGNSTTRFEREPRARAARARCAKLATPTGEGTMIFKRRIQDVPTGPTTFIAPSTHIVGTVVGQGPYVFCGSVEGDCDINGPVTLAEGGRWKGTLKGTDVIVAGIVEGD